MKTAVVVSLFLSLFSFSALAQQYSSTVCNAYTQCYATDAYGRTFPNGIISCQAYGSAYAGYTGSAQSQCSFWVEPYTSVTCRGFTQATDIYGNVVWGWQNFHFRCPGR